MIAFGRERADEVVADVVRMDLAEDMRLADAARDQLRDLGAEVEDQDLVVHGGQAKGPAEVTAATALAPLAAKVQPGQHQRAELQGGAEVERRADAPVALRQVRHDAEQRRADHRRDDRHQAVQAAHGAHRLALGAAHRRRAR